MDSQVSRTKTCGGTTSYPLPALAEPGGFSPDRTMRRSQAALALTTVLFLLAGAGSAEAQKVGTCTLALGQAYLDISNVRARIYNSGQLFWRYPQKEPWSGYEVPKGGGTHTVFTSGIWVGGLIDGELRVAATTWNAG